MMKPAFWIWMLFWSVFTGGAMTALLVIMAQPTAIHFIAAAVACAIISVPFSLSAGKALAASSKA